MKRNTKIILSTVGILAIVGISTGAMAFDGDCKRGASKFDGAKIEHRVEKMKDHLGLTDQQAKEIKAILEAKKDLKQDRRSERKGSHQAMMQLDPASPDYDQQVNKMAEEKGAMVAQKIRERAATRKQIHAILTPEQREKAKAMHEKRKERSKDRRDDNHRG